MLSDEYDSEEDEESDYDDEMIIQPRFESVEDSMMGRLAIMICKLLLKNLI